MALIPPRKDLNSSTLVGIVAGMVLIVVSVLLSAEEPGIFLNLPGLLIVIGGTIAATFISYPMKELRQVYRSFRVIWRHHDFPVDREIEEIVRVSILLGHGKLAAIEDAMARINNPFLRTGIQLVIDRTPTSDIDALLKWRIFKLRRQEWGEAQVFRSMATFAPAFGMAGTLLGLVNMLQAMDGADFKVIGLNLGIALTTTLYGIILANLLFKPVAIKLERRTEQRVMLMYMVLEGISMLGQKRNPSFIRETLNSFVAQYEDEIHSPSLEEIEQLVEAETDGVAPQEQGGAALRERRRAHLPPPPQWEDEPLPDDSDGGWLIIYLDVMTLMLSLFVLLLAYSTYSDEDYQILTRTLSNPVAVRGEVTAPVEPVLQLKEQEAAIDKPAEIEAEQQLEEQFRSALKSQGLADSIEVTVSANQVNIQIRESILFELGRAELTEEGQGVLVKLVPLLANASEHTLSIEGHTDSSPIATPQFPSNWELSAQRATGVLRFLLSQGIASERMRAVGYADTQPLADNDTEEGRARNRRVSLVLHLSGSD